VVVVDGERREVEVDLERQTVRVGDHAWPLQVDSSGSGSVIFEILGERVEVRTEGLGTEASHGTFTVNGEVHSLAVESSVGNVSRSPVPNRTLASSPSAVSSLEKGAEGPGRAILPPMPGKVLEVRVRNGEKVRAGQVLLVVEAMKMRNEVTSPSAGEVAGLRVTPGANVAAHEVLLRILGP
jgi:glutaconyl-CoA/methylmalonyl-CoA decarboxylase subunit gamma